jgi:sugar phosphate isomerase/epimerase
MPTRLAAQLYTLRDFCKTPDDIAKSMKKVAAIGYKAVQASALGPIEPKELRKILDDNGLECCATHKSLDAMLKETDAVIEEHRTLGCKYTALGGFFPKPQEMTEANWSKFIDDFNKAATKFEGSGVRLGYHNHHHEFASLGGPGSKTIWQLLVDKLRPDIFLEVDTYWVQHGGGDPAAWIEKLAGRVPCVHLKDMGIGLDKAHQMRSVGGGNMNFDRILSTCKSAGVQWHIVEQDNCNGLDPFDCLKSSLEWLKAKGLS